MIYDSELLKYIFNNSNVGIAICNVRDNRIETVNPTFAKMYGYKQHELIGVMPITVFSSECMSHIKEYEKNIAYDNTSDYSFETIYIKKNGSAIPVSIHITIIKDENGDIKYRIVNIVDISNKKNIDKELKLRDLEYLNLVENLPDAIVRYDTQFRRTYVNREWKRINGLSEAEVLDKTPMELSGVIKPISQEFQNKLKNVMSSGKLDEWDFDFQGIDGLSYTYSIRAIPEYDFVGNITGVITTARNITKRKLEEEEKNNEQLRLFFERQLVGMAITSHEKGWIKVNDKLCDMLGYSFEEFRNMTWTQMTYSEDLQADIEQFNMLIKGEIEDYTIEKRFIHKNGSIVYTNLAVSCVRKDDGSIDYVLALIEDITQRVSAQNKLQTLNATLEQVVYERTIELQQAVDLLHLEISHRKSAQQELVIKEEKFRTLAENSPNIIMRYDENCDRIYSNPAFAKQTGSCVPLELIKSHNADTKSEIEINMLNMTVREYKERVKEVFKNGKSDSFLVEWIRCTDGVQVAHDINLVAEKNNQGDIIGVVAIGHDITKQLETQRELKQSIEFTEGIINAIPDLLFEVDRNGVYRNIWSHNAKQIIANKEYLIGKKINDILTPESTKVAYEAIEEANKKGVSFGKIYNILYPEGERWFELSISKRTTGSFLALARDITERKNIENRIEFIAHHDTLTGLPNRVLLQDRAEKIIIKSNLNLKKSAFLFIDLDGFKTINDSMGHSFGDIVLKTVANRLQSCIRATDTLSRHGGDEFVVIIPEIIYIDEAEIIAIKIMQEFEKSFEINNQTLSTTASIGIAIYPEHGENFEQLLQNSDTAMYKAKENGKNTYCFFTQQMKHNMMDLFQMQNDLKEAIRNKEFILHYQPQIDLCTNKIIGVEALIRWKHPVIGMVPPLSFISVAESCGCILEIGEWVIHEACRQGAIWNKNGKDIVVAVNVSAVQFKRGNLIAVVKNALKTSGLNPKYLELELTESILISDTENVLQSVRAIKELGVQLSIDDFGTGYSSLAYLKRFAVDKLKIDQSFVRDIVNDKEDATIVKTIITMAKSFNLKSIAEGVENEEVLSVLQEFGCDEVQGYHFAKPMISHEFEEYYRSISINNFL